MNKTMKIRRQKIRERVGSISLGSLCGHFDEVINHLQNLQSSYAEAFPDASEIWIEDNNWADEFTGELDVYIERSENDKEYNARVKKLMKIKNQERSAKDQEEYEEYQTYLKLKRKYSK
jgi:hypothetical protein